MTLVNLPKRVELSCQHIMSFIAPYPKLADTVYCRRCVGYSQVVSTLDEYRVRCGSCPLSRVYGRDLDRARAVASKHVMARGHTVSIWDGSEVLETLAPDENQGELPFASTLTKRAAEVAEHQKVLRDFVQSLPNRNRPER